MRLLAYYCLGGFGLTLLVNLLTYLEDRWYPNLGNSAISVLVLLLLIAMVAAALSLVVGFGTTAIPIQQRGLLASLRAVPLFLWVIVGLGVGYGLVLASTIETPTISLKAGAYYVSTADETGVPGSKRHIDEVEYYHFNARLARVITGNVMNLFSLAAMLFLSRSLRYSRELEKFNELKFESGQVDDSMGNMT